jgi:hypothetical protein
MLTVVGCGTCIKTQQRHNQAAESSEQQQCCNSTSSNKSGVLQHTEAAFTMMTRSQLLLASNA